MRTILKVTGNIRTLSRSNGVCSRNCAATGTRRFRYRKTGICPPTSVRFRDELKNLVINNFAGQSAWAWKDPRSCLLLPLWRDVLDELQMELSCVYAVRSPIDVKNSLNKREPIPLNKAMGVWFNYCITALKDTVGVPTVFLNYDKFLTSWETEMHRVADGLKLDWPTDEASLRAMMNSFLRPDLRHNRSTEADLKSAPHPARELYELLLDAGSKLDARDERFEKIVGALSADFCDYAKFYENDLNSTMKLPFIPRTLKRWRRSFRKRFSKKA